MSSDRRICASCQFWCPSYVGTQTRGYCCWREWWGKRHQPRMNIGSDFFVSADKTVLETNWDASCQMWQTKQIKPK